MSGNLNLYTVNLHQLVSFLNVFLVDEVIGIAWVHYDNNPVLNPFLTDGEHYLVELIFACPLFRFIADESRNALNGFQFCSLVPGRSLDTPEHDTALSHLIDYIRLGSLEILSCSVKFYLLHHFGDDRHTGRNHRVASIEYLMNYLLYGSHFKGQPLNESGSVERFSRTTPTGDKNYEFFLIGVQRVINFLRLYHFNLSLIQESILIP